MGGDNDGDSDAAAAYERPALPLLTPQEADEARAGHRSGTLIVVGSLVIALVIIAIMAGTLVYTWAFFTLVFLSGSLTLSPVVAVCRRLSPVVAG